MKRETLDFGKADLAVGVLRDAAQANREDPARTGSLLRFGAAGQLVMTGDMHGNLRNFEKLQRYCDLEHNPARFVVLHELIHSELNGHGEGDTSIDLLVRAAAWKCEHPDNVFFLQSNHELAQLRRQEIMKGGRSVIHEFDEGVRRRYGSRAGDVLAATEDYIASLPLAARTANRIWLSHSLPDPLMMDHYDLSVFERQPTAGDYAPGGAAYALVWGRYHTPPALDAFARRLDVDLFVIGHTPQEDGFRVTGRLMIIASEHNHGCFLPINLNRSYTIEEIQAALRKFVSVE